MSVSSVLVIPPSAESNAESAVVPLAQSAPRLIPGRDPSRESGAPQIERSQSIASQDEVKVQIESPGAIAVYQFLNQDGTLVLQVPPQQWLDLAQEISKELAQEAAPKAGLVKKGEGNGH